MKRWISQQDIHRVTGGSMTDICNALRKVSRMGGRPYMYKVDEAKEALIAYYTLKREIATARADVIDRQWKDKIDRVERLGE